MSATAPHKADGPATLETLHDATRCYRLRNSNMTNEQIARRLGLWVGNSDSTGYPCCIFFRHASVTGGFEIYPVAIRTKADELVIFRCYQMHQDKMTGIGERVFG